MEHNLIRLFLAIFNMSITASVVILIVLLLRIFLIKAPKIFSYGLWSIVFFRLFFPASISSSMSLTGDNKNTNYCFYVMDNEVWLASYVDNTADGSEITMMLWKLN